VKRSPMNRGVSALKRVARLLPIGRRGREARAQLQAVRAEVMRLARGRCERCGFRGRLDLHHRLPRSRGGSHDALNLAVLCSGPDGCHAKAHAHLIPDWREWIVRRSP
jgi:5-methylcytosine-specific restriction endonuclease McrA